MFIWSTLILSLIISSAPVLNQEFGNIGLAIEGFNPCKNNVLFMERLIGKPPSKENYWDGSFDMDVHKQSEARIMLKLTAPAEISVNPDDARVHLTDRTFYINFFPPEEGFKKPLKFHVQGEQGGSFPNIQSLKLNGADVCPDPGQWKLVILGAAGSEKDSGLNKTDNTLKCGKRLVNHQELVKGGELTKEGEWPWHAAIFHQEGSNSFAYKCGGTLLNTNTVLTAAHCVVQRGQFIVPERVLVKLGLHHRFIAGSGNHAQEFQVFKIIPHEKFNFTFLYNDIAILKLSTEATYTNYVQPVCLWPELDTDISSLIGKPGDVIGWGFYDKENKLSDYLGYGTMPIVSAFTCLESNRGFFGHFVSDQSFCAGYRNGTSVCNGDSGGGMFFEQNGAYLQRGIVSVSVSLKNEQICNPYEYVIFTDVAQYLDWIKPLL